MSKSARITLAVVGVLLIGALLFYAGLAYAGNPRISAWPGNMASGGMMGTGDNLSWDGSGMGLMNMMGGNYGAGMMGGSFGRGMNGGFGSGRMGGSFGSGMGMMNMSGGSFGGMMDGSFGSGMMGGSFGSGMLGGGFGYGILGAYDTDADPLTLEAAQDAVQEYLLDLDVDGLSLGEIMIFDNHAYAQIVETDTGIGAMEVLVDPISLTVYPEHGPNMMWNLKYSLMGAGMMDGAYGNGMMGSAGGMMGMMMSGSGGMMGSASGLLGGQAGAGTLGDLFNPLAYADVSAELDISPEEAVELASAYLADNLPDYSVADEADAFYGYYTLHILKDGEVAGMLSVNGFNGQVFLHHWHGDFIEMSHE